MRLLAKVKTLFYWFSSVLSLLSLSLVLLLGWLLFTSMGGQWLLQQVPGLTVSGFQGQLINQWQAKQVQWQNPHVSLTFDNLEVSWQPSCLLDRKVCLHNLELVKVSIITRLETKAAINSLPLDWSSLRLPSIELPKLDLLELAYLNSLEVDRLSLRSLEINGQQLLNNLQLSADWHSTKINLHHLALQSPWLPADLKNKDSKNTKVQLKGWLVAEENWPLEVNLTSELSSVPLEVALAGDFAKLNLEAKLAATNKQKPTSINLNGWVNLLEPAAPLDLTLAWQNLDPQSFYPQMVNWPTNLQLIKGKLALQGNLETGWHLAVNTQQKLDQLPVNLKLNSNFSWHKLAIEDLRLNLGDGSWLALQLELAEIVSQEFKLAGQMTASLVTELPEPTQLNSQFSGFLDTNSLNTDASKITRANYKLALTEFKLKTGKDKLALKLDLNPERWQSTLGLEVGDFDALINALLKVITNNLPEVLSASEAELLITKYQLQGDLQLAAAVDIQALPVTKEVKAQEVLQFLSQGKHQLNLAFKHLSYAGIQLDNTDLDFTYSGQKNTQDPKLSLKLISQQLKVQNQKQQVETLLLEEIKVSLVGLLSKHQLTAGFTLDKQPLEAGIQGGVQFNSFEEFEWHYQLTTLASELVQPWLPEELRWTDQLDGELTGHWKSKQLRASLELASGPGELAVKLEDTLNKTFDWVPLTYHLLNLGLTLQNDQLTAQLTLDGEQLGYLNTDVTLALYPNAATQQRTIKGNYQLNGLQLQLFSPFVQIDQISGKIAGQGEIRGHLLAPELWGDLQLKEVALADTHWPVTLQRLDGQLLLQGERMQLSANFTSGEGSEGQLKGEMFWQPEITARLHLTGEAFQVRVEPFANLQVTPDLIFSYQEQAFLLAGQVRIPSGLISIKQLPKQAIKVSEDAQVVGREVVSNGNPRVDLDIELLLGNAQQPDKPPLRLEALGLNAEIQGRLRVTKDLQTRGELLLVNGVYESWGQDLKLRKARLNFAGPFRLPFLDIEAVREVQNIVVGIHMTGRVDQPQAEIFSEPSMANEQALSWLILGRPIRTKKDENTLNAAAISYGLKQATGITGRLGESLGLKDFQLIAEGGGSETSVVASGHINDRLSVSYGVGIYDEVSRFVVRYDLTRRVYIEAASSLASSLDIFWRLDF